jgi:hypothetical protein
MGKSNAERVADYRFRQLIARKPDATRKNAKAHKAAWRAKGGAGLAPFVGCDGEGIWAGPWFDAKSGEPIAGGPRALERAQAEGRTLRRQQDYMLFRMGDRELYTGRRLTSYQLLDFICDAPARRLYVGFGFDYDASMILRDLPPLQLQKLFAERVQEKGKSNWTYYRQFNIEYLPKNYLKVMRVRIELDPDTGRERRIPIKGTRRIIHDVFGDFQTSFLTALKEFSLGAEHLAMLARHKAGRAAFEAITPDIRAYCAAECDLMAQLMERFRDNCHAAEIRPRSWDGAGKLAKALHKQNHTPEAGQVAAWLNRWPGVQAYAQMAYYGGRFEITRTGRVKPEGGVYEYDVGSAHPASMAFGGLPCLEHGVWTYSRAPRTIAAHVAGGGLALCSVRFEHPAWDDPHGQLCGLPVRLPPDGLPSRPPTRRGPRSAVFVSPQTNTAAGAAQLPAALRAAPSGLAWPRMGGGVYWSPEITSAQHLGARITWRNAWLYHPRCSCRPFQWITQAYERRKELDKAGRGRPLKHALAATYGTLSQRKGFGRYTNMLWAGLITAQTRTKLNMAVATAAPGSVLMLATDALYTTQPIAGLDLGPGLGQWKEKRLGGLMIVQPGVYWDTTRCEAPKRATRGFSGKLFEAEAPHFERLWDQYLGRRQAGAPLPARRIPLDIFLGLRLAVRARRDPGQACYWEKGSRLVSFEYQHKREGGQLVGEALVTAPRAGDPHLESWPHADFLRAGGHEPWENAREELEADPNGVYLGRPWADD